MRLKVNGAALAGLMLISGATLGVHHLEQTSANNNQNDAERQVLAALSYDSKVELDEAPNSVFASLASTAPETSNQQLASAATERSQAEAVETTVPAATVVATTVVPTPVRRTAAIPLTVQPPAPRVERVTTGQVRVLVTFYYCERTVFRAGDDGGTFCGLTRSEIPVHYGSAACDYQWFLERRRFTVEGDPLGLIYTCEDTGSGVGGPHVDLWRQTNGEGYVWPGTRESTIHFVN